MLARLEFKEQNRDEKAEPEAFQKIGREVRGGVQGRGRRGQGGSAASTSSAPSATSRAASTTSSAAAPGARVTPGRARFYLSLEDDLMRIFAGDRVKSLMERMGMPDDEPIEHPWVTKSIGDAQKKVEERNFDIRKNLLEYDDVMSEQRKTVYTIRQQLLLGIYKPERLDDDGKPTGKMREIKPLDATRRGREAGRRADASSTTGRRCDPRAANGEPPPPRPMKVLGGEGALLDRFAPRGHLQVLGLPHRLQGGRGEGAAEGLRPAPRRGPAVAHRAARALARPGRRDPRRHRRGVLPVEQAAGGLGLEGHPGRFHRALRREARPTYESTVRPRGARAAALPRRPRRASRRRRRSSGRSSSCASSATSTWRRSTARGSSTSRTWSTCATASASAATARRTRSRSTRKRATTSSSTMMAATSSNVATKLFKVQVQKEKEIERIEREDAERHAAQQRAHADAPRVGGGRRGDRTLDRSPPSCRHGRSPGRFSSRRSDRGRRSAGTTRARAVAVKSSRSATARRWKKAAERPTTRVRRVTLTVIPRPSAAEGTLTVIPRPSAAEQSCRSGLRGLGETLAASAYLGSSRRFAPLGMTSLGDARRAREPRFRSPRVCSKVRGHANPSSPWCSRHRVHARLRLAAAHRVRRVGRRSERAHQAGRHARRAAVDRRLLQPRVRLPARRAERRQGHRQMEARRPERVGRALRRRHRQRRPLPVERAQVRAGRPRRGGRAARGTSSTR